MDNHKDNSDTNLDGLDSYRGGEDDTEYHGDDDALDTYREEDPTDNGGMSTSHNHDELDDSLRSSTPESADHQSSKSIDHDETRMVNRSKIIVYLVILLSAAVAGTLTYLFVKEEEKRWYEDEVRPKKKQDGANDLVSVY